MVRFLAGGDEFVVGVVAVVGFLDAVVAVFEVSFAVEVVDVSVDAGGVTGVVSVVLISV